MQGPKSWKRGRYATARLANTSLVRVESELCIRSLTVLALLKLSVGASSNLQSKSVPFSPLVHDMKMDLGANARKNADRDHKKTA